MKYHFNPKIGINIKGVAGTVWRKEYGFREILYVGPDQFDFELYDMTGKIVRVDELLINSFTFLGIALGLEYTF